jgi:hypothetical protein
MQGTKGLADAPTAFERLTINREMPLFRACVLCRGFTGDARSHQLNLGVETSLKSGRLETT